MDIHMAVNFISNVIYSNPMTHPTTQSNWREEFYEEFNDITHITCAGIEDRIPCATLKRDILSFIEKTIEEERNKAFNEGFKEGVIKSGDAMIAVYAKKYSHVTREYTEADHFRDDVFKAIYSLK